MLVSSFDGQGVSALVTRRRLHPYVRPRSGPHRSRIHSTRNRIFLPSPRRRSERVHSHRSSFSKATTEFRTLVQPVHQSLKHSAIFDKASYPYTCLILATINLERLRHVLFFSTVRCPISLHRTKRLTNNGCSKIALASELTDGLAPCEIDSSARI